jgi:two-component system OmpR family response regulator
VRILVVEDHRATRTMVELALRERGHTVDGVESVAQAQDRLRADTYDVVVLDWMLPDGSGVELCRTMRAGGRSVPVLMLTARGEVADRVSGLDAGADDYLRKPFAVTELLARLRALARRGPRIVDAVVTDGHLEIQLDSRRVLADGKEIPLTSREFQILELLLRRGGRVVTKSDILVSVWGAESPGAEASLEVLVSRLRRKLAFDEAGPLRTHRGLGYSLRFPA